MSKYIRSLHKLVDLTQYIFTETAISVDTKAIVLFLAGTMHSTEFIPWIDGITALEGLNIKFKEINNLRSEIGPICEVYILLKILRKIKRDINSDELQRFISDNDLTITEVREPQTADINFLVSVAKSQLQQRLAQVDNAQLSNIVDAFTNCRQFAATQEVYLAVVQAMQDILIAGGATANFAAENSKKLAAHALSQFTATSDDAFKILRFSKRA